MEQIYSPYYFVWTFINDTFFSDLQAIWIMGGPPFSFAFQFLLLPLFEIFPYNDYFIYEYIFFSPVC